MLWLCNGCGTSYSVDAPHCPQCSATEHHTSEDPTPEQKPVETGGKAKKADA